MGFRILGPIEFWRDDRLAAIGPPQRRAVLALLLLARGGVVSVERIVEVLWSGDPPRSAVKNVHVSVSQLRKVVGDRLVSRAPGYRLRLDPNELDLDQFETEIGRARAERDAGQLAAASDWYTTALARWRGPALADVVAAGLLRPAATRLDERRLRVVEEHLEVRLTIDGPDAVLDDLAALVAEHPLHERLHELRIRALYESGRASQAGAAYQEAMEILDRELGLVPGPALRELARVIAAGQPLAARSSPAAEHGPRDELPPDPAVFVGRADELDRLSAVTGVRVISGPAGIGKSALARRLARTLAAQHSDGLLYVDLSGTAPGSAPLPPIAVLHRFLRTLGVTATALPADLQEASAQFRSLVATRRILVVLDDAADAQQVRWLLPGGGCGAIVTCRRPLALLDAAVHLTLAGLPEAAALELFERFAGRDRMRADPAATEALIGWCGGLPLAVCLAGARLAAKPGWSVRQLSVRLADARLRLDELRLGDTAIRTAFAVGYRGLRDPTAAAVFRLLGLLDCPEVNGPVLAAMAEGDVTPALDELVDAQLVEEPSPGRYRLHDLLRLFARERAEEQDAPDVREAAVHRGLRHYLVTAARASRLLQPEQNLVIPDDPGAGEPLGDRATALSYLEAERINLLAAVAQANKGPDDHARLVPQLARALFWFFRTRSYFLDWVNLGEAALAVARRLGDVAAEAQARNDLGSAYERAMRLPEAKEHLTAALELRRAADDRRGEAATLSNLGIVCWYQRDYADAHRYLLAARRLWRALDERHSEARTQTNLGLVHMSTGNPDAAVRCYRAALKVFAEVDDADGQLRTLGNLAEVEVAKGRFSAAERLVRRSLALAREIGDPQSEASLLLDLGDICLRLGSPSAAQGHAEAALAMFQLIELRWWEGDALRRLGAILAASGQNEQAHAHWHRALAVFSELGAPEADDVRATLHSAQNRRATATVSVPDAFQSPANGLSPQQP